MGPADWGIRSNRRISRCERQRRFPWRSAPGCLSSVPGFPRHPVIKAWDFCIEAQLINPHDATYHQLLTECLGRGEKRSDRTGTGTYGLFSETMKFDLSETFPLLTTKSIHWKSVVHELLWFLSGDTNVKYLNDNGVHIWDEWADSHGDLGPIYGAQWRYWMDGDVPVDQIKNLIDGLKNDPFGRRHIVTAWNPGEVRFMKLPPCHMIFQFWVCASDNSLHCQLMQRSADVFLGVPFNIASYSLLTCMLADTLGFKRGSFSWLGVDVHLYTNHVSQAREQLERSSFAPPTLAPIQREDILSLRYEDIVLNDYQHHPSIKAQVAV